MLIDIVVNPQKSVLLINKAVYKRANKTRLATPALRGAGGPSGGAIDPAPFLEERIEASPAR
jgi:hypothetical protein